MQVKGGKYIPPELHRAAALTWGAAGPGFKAVEQLYLGPIRGSFSQFSTWPGTILGAQFQYYKDEEPKTAVQNGPS